MGRKEFCIGKDSTATEFNAFLKKVDVVSIHAYIDTHGWQVTVVKYKEV